MLARAGLAVTRRRPLDGADYVRYFGREAVEQRRFYNVGAGSFRHPCWTNIDHASAWYSAEQSRFLEHDLMFGTALPIPDGAAEIIYSSHTIEHVTDEAVDRLLAECHRALKPGGVLRITTGPDADLDSAALLRRDEAWFYWDPSDRPIEEKWLHHVASALAPQSQSPGPKVSAAEVREGIERPGYLDELTARVAYDPDRPGNHVSWWNADKLIAAFNRAGFSGAYRSGYGQSVCPVLRNTDHFDTTHPQISVYVEAIR